MPCRSFQASFPAAMRVRAAMNTPIRATVKPVWAWVISSTTARRKIPQLRAKSRRFVMAVCGAGQVRARIACWPSFFPSSLWKRK